MSEKGKNRSAEVSRRKFLRDTGLIIGGVATLGISGLALTGCSVAPDCAAAGESYSTTEASSQVNTEYFGECICPNCGNSQPHPRGVPCRMINCPECGVSMGRGAI